MAQTPVIYALKRKRAVISGELRKAEDRCAAMRQHLAAMDQTLKLMGYEGAPEDIRPIKPRGRLFRQGELPRAIMDILRQANGPMTDGELVVLVMAMKGLDPNYVDLRRTVAEIVKATRKRLASAHIGLSR
jgi:hypothetical protein